MLRRAERLQGVHSDLRQVVELAVAYCKHDIILVEGLRTLERQKQLFAQRKSMTMASRHLTGHAVDLAPVYDKDGDGDLDVVWDWTDMFEIAGAMKQASHKLKVPIEWGGDWVKFKDGPHFQLPWKLYPKEK